MAAGGIAQRIKGQEVHIEILVNGVPQSTFSDIKSFSVTPKLEKKEEQYLGETTMRYDEIFNGVDFDMEVNFHDKGVVTFFETIYARAVRRDAGATNTVVNIKASLQFPKGEVVRVVLADCFFSDMPINFGGRSDYGTFKVAGSCADWKAIGN
jgi:hypothetical protein